MAGVELGVLEEKRYVFDKGAIRLVIPDGHVGRARGKRRKFVSFHGGRWIRELPGGGTDVETVVIDRGNCIRGRAH